MNDSIGFAIKCNQCNAKETTGILSEDIVKSKIGERDKIIVDIKNGLPVLKCKVCGQERQMYNFE